MKITKHILVILVSSMFLICSCNESNRNSKINEEVNDSIIEKGCESFLLTKVNDPNSYKRISIKIIDTTYDVNHLESILNDFYVMSDLDKLIYNKDEIAKKENERDSVIKLVEHLKNNPKENKLMCYTCEINYKAKNGFNALMTGRATIKYFPKDKNYLLYSNK